MVLQGEELGSCFGVQVWFTQTSHVSHLACSLIRVPQYHCIDRPSSCWDQSCTCRERAKFNKLGYYGNCARAVAFQMPEDLRTLKHKLSVCVSSCQVALLCCTVRVCGFTRSPVIILCAFVASNEVLAVWWKLFNHANQRHARSMWRYYNRSRTSSKADLIRMTLHCVPADRKGGRLETGNLKQETGKRKSWWSKAAHLQHVPL